MNITSQNLMKFISNSPTAFHAVSSIIKILKREEFIELNENKPFNLEKGKNYYVTRNNSSIIAFKVGETLDNYAFNMIASHTDCPSFKVKQNEDNSNGSYANLVVEGYGGMLCAPWFDRPLSIAGRVLVKNNDHVESKLINFNKNLLSIPSICIHMNREANAGYKYNLAVDMQPTISLDVNFKLRDLIASELKANKEDIISHDLYLYNREEGYFWGANDEFISSFKLDDLQCAYTSLLAFTKSVNPHNISVYCSFDNEEVGSTTEQGANSTFLEETIKRISLSLGKSEEEHLIAISNSFMVSADNAHAIHPTHPELSDKKNNVAMNKGIVLKVNASQSYCSDSLSLAVFKNICDKVEVPTQIFYNRSDLRGGGTLGNISNTHVSLKSIDIGLATLAMHSINETAGSLDSDYMVKACKEFYETVLKFEDNNILFEK